MLYKQVSQVTIVIKCSPLAQDVVNSPTLEDRMMI